LEHDAGSYLPRLVDERLGAVLARFPAALILGPRASGKTTTARRIAADVVELDDPPQAVPFQADPTAALRYRLERADGPVLLDEWQVVPEVLGAVKRAVDGGAGPGSVVLTGSVRAGLVAAAWPGTGRVIEIDMYPMTELEQRATSRVSSTVVAQMFAGGAADLALPAVPDLVEYVHLALAGGFPPVVGLDQRDRQEWLRSYLQQLVLRDVAELREVRDPAGLNRLVRAIAEHSGGIVADTELSYATDMDVKTVRRHERLLADLRIVDSLPAWHSNRISRLTKARKRFLVDSGLCATLLGADVAGVMRDGGLLGRMLETFVLAQLRPLLVGHQLDVRAYHLRQQDGRHEVDLILESAAGHVVGIEIKAAAAARSTDARHLHWLREQLGDRFVAGIVLGTGRAIYPLGERITHVPIAALWGSSA
jgi:predicted AAA+ superfamily ATPase